MERPQLTQGSHALLSVNQLGQNLRILTVGPRGRVSRTKSEELMLGLEDLYAKCLDWSDSFLPAARTEYAALKSGEISDFDIPAFRAESLVFNAVFLRILAGCYHLWLEDEQDWKPLAEFVRGVSLEIGGSRGNVLVDCGAMLPGDRAPIGRRQEVAGAIQHIVRQAREKRSEGGLFGA